MFLPLIVIFTNYFELFYDYFEIRIRSKVTKEKEEVFHVEFNHVYNEILLLSFKLFSEIVFLRYRL